MTPWLLAWLAGCSLSTIYVAECDDAPGICIDLFGYGSTCDDDEDICVMTEPAEPACTFEGELLGKRPDEVGAFGVLVDTTMGESAHNAVLTALQSGVLVSGDGGEGPDVPIAAVICDVAPRDDITSTENAREQGLFLIELGLPLIIGPGSTELAEEAWYQIQTNEGTPTMIATAATGLSLHDDFDGAGHSAEDPGRFWRTGGSDVHAARRMGSDLEDTFGGQELLVLHRGDDGDYLSQELASRYPSGFVERKRFGITSEIGATLAESNTFQAVALISDDYNDSVELLQALVGIVSPMPVYLPQSGDRQELAGDAQLPGEWFSSVYGVRRDHPQNEAWQQFNQAVANGAGAPPVGDEAALMWDALWMGLYGLHVAKAHNDDNYVSGREVSTGIWSVAGGETAVNVGGMDFPTGTMLAASEGINLMGASGPLDIESGTQEIETTFGIWTPNPPTAGGGNMLVALCNPGEACVNVGPETR